jgi:hypothetical protein
LQSHRRPYPHRLAAAFGLAHVEPKCSERAAPGDSKEAKASPEVAPDPVGLIEDIVERSWRSGEPLIQKYEVPRDQAGDVLELCEAFGVCGATMFPGADGAARAALERRARFDDEEARRG